MLRVSKLTDYGSVILVYMACRPHEMMSAASLAKGVYLPKSTVRKLLKVLAKNGLLCSGRGRHGGYQLARPAADISLADIISAVEGSIALTECSVRPGLCQTEAHCGIRQNWQGINRIIYQSLAQVSLQQMLQAEYESIPVVPRIC